MPVECVAGLVRLAVLDRQLDRRVALFDRRERSRTLAHALSVDVEIGVGPAGPRLCDECGPDLEGAGVAACSREAPGDAIDETGIAVEHRLEPGPRILVWRDHRDLEARERKHMPPAAARLNVPRHVVDDRVHDLDRLARAGRAHVRRGALDPRGQRGFQPANASQDVHGRHLINARSAAALTISPASGAAAAPP